MPSSMVGPGTLLAGRYRVEDHVLDAAGTSYWRGFDELLHRDVGIRTVPSVRPEASRLAAAARAAAGISDGRFLAVLDIAEDDGRLCVVSEWPNGPTLEELLAGGPLPARYATHVVAEVADALAAAHDRRLWHGALRPAAVVVQETGEVTVVGLEVDAVIAGLPEWDRTDSSAAAAAAARDAQGCGALLYAALTGRWPLAHDPACPSALPPAGRAGHTPPAPRQLRGGLPSTLDVLTMRALAPRADRHGGLLTPREVATALTGLSWPEQWRHELDDEPLDGRVWPLAPHPPGQPPTRLVPPGLPSLEGSAVPPVRGRRPLLILAVLLLATLIALLGWQAATTVTGEQGPAPTSSTPTDTQPAPTVPDNADAGAPAAGDHPILPVAAVSDVDPQGDGQESPDDVGYAIDGDPRTAWTTRAYYRRADLGGLKEGVGLLLDLGTVTQVSAVELRLRGDDSDVTLARGDNAAAPVPEGYTVLARARSAGPQVSVSLPDPILTRYLLVWLTRLPPDGPDTYRGGVAEVTVRGLS